MENTEVRAVQYHKTGVKILKERLEWVLDRQIIESAEETKTELSSPVYDIQLGNKSTKWYIQTCTEGENGDMYVYLVLASYSQLPEMPSNKGMMKFSIKTADGQLTASQISQMELLSEFEPGNGFDTFYKIKYLPELCVNEKLTIVCDLSITIEKDESIRSFTDEQVKYDTKESETQFVENMKTLYSLSSFSDLVIFCGDQKFLCHKNVLASRSDVLRDMLEKIGGELEVTDSSPDTLKILIDHIYTGKIPNNIDTVAAELFRLATKYNLQILSKACEISLLSKLTDENALETLLILDEHNSTTGAKNAVIKYIALNAIEIIDTEEFQTFAKERTKLMIEIVRCLAVNQKTELLSTTSKKRKTEGIA